MIRHRLLAFIATVALTGWLARPAKADENQPQIDVRLINAHFVCVHHRANGPDWQQGWENCAAVEEKYQASRAPSAPRDDAADHAIVNGASGSAN